MTRVLTGAICAIALALAGPAHASTANHLSRHCLVDSGPPAGGVAHANHMEPATFHGGATLDTIAATDTVASDSFASDAPEPTASPTPEWAEPLGQRLRGFDRLVAHPPNLKESVWTQSNLPGHRWQLPEVERVAWNVSPGFALRV